MRSISGFVALLLLAATPCIALVPTSDANDSSFLENWMQNLMPVLKTSKLSDLCLPGTHDTMTYDLSTTVSDDANDLPIAESQMDFNQSLMVLMKPLTQTCPSFMIPEDLELRVTRL